MIQPGPLQIDIALSNILTAGLLMLTGWYAYATRELVKETRKAREAEKDRRDERLARQKKTLRKTLKSEIGLLDEHHNIKTSDGRTASALRRASSTAVYERNADKLGLLTQDEIDAIVDFYTDIELLEELYQDEVTRDDNELDIRSEDLLEKQNEALDALNARLRRQDEQGLLAHD